MKLRTKAWLVSQGLLVITACIIQFTFHREIKVGPLLNTPTRDYWDIIKNVEPEVPQKLIDLKLPPEFYDARLAMSSDQVLARNLVAHRRAVRQEDGIRKRQTKAPGRNCPCHRAHNWRCPQAKAMA